MDTISNYPLALSIIVALPLFGVVARLFGVSFERLVKWYLYVAVFAVVVVLNSIFFPFIGGKDYFFRFSIELALIFFILWWAFEARSGEVRDLMQFSLKKPLFIAVSAFVIVFLLACLFAYDPNAAFWSNYERGEGGFQMIHYYIFFALLSFLFRKEEDWKNIFKFSLVAAAIMILYGLLGNFLVNGFIGPYAGSPTPPSGWWQKLVKERFLGSLGNPAYVAPYLIFSMFYTAYLWVKRKVSPASRAFAHAEYGTLIVFFLIFFILSQTRGAFLGLGVGIFALILYLLFSTKGVMRKWATAVLGVMVIGGIGLYAVRNAAFTQNIPAGRLLQISLSDDSAQTRLWVWGEAWKGFLERPVLGWGPENFTPVFDKYFNPKFFVPGKQTETWFDRAHSVFFDYLSEIGILGLLSYLAIFFFFFWEFFRKRRENANSESALEQGLVLALSVAYLVQGIAIFDVLPMYLNLFLFFAFAYYYFYEKHGQRR